MFAARAPFYPVDESREVKSRSRLRSSTSRLLNVRPGRLVTVDDRSFSTAGPPLCTLQQPAGNRPVCLVADISAKTEVTFI